MLKIIKQYFKVKVWEELGKPRDQKVHFLFINFSIIIIIINFAFILN